MTEDPPCTGYSRSVIYELLLAKGVADRYWKVGGAGEQVLKIPYIIFTHTITSMSNFCVTRLPYFFFDQEESYRG